ncbi:MAG TPA: hypothetical protein PLS49_04100 [Candidatus Woesebacteria bacterium]|nr:hypothetical protein [Candidatus Woesebacteria bacterium]
MDYFAQEQFIAQVDTNDNIIGKVEKWQAHTEAILHRAFTVAIYFEDTLVLQHRKHLVFDTVFDITISSHQIYKGNILQSDEEALMDTLQREWNISEIIGKPVLKGTIYYQASDPFSKYTEHEMCRIYACQVQQLPMPNFEFAYGFSLLDPKKIQDKNYPLFPLLAPWVKKTFEEGLL